MEKPNFYGILPADIRYNKNLKPMEKILYTEITALSNKEGYCYATNSYFANLYEVHKNTVSSWINNLEKQGYIKTVLIYKKGRKEIEERRIYINTKNALPINENIDTYQQKDCDPINKKIDTPINKKVEDNNTSINNTRLILNNSIKESKKEKIGKLEEAIEDFEKMRKSIKKPLTERAKKILLLKLNELSNNDEELAIKILEQSILNSWQSIYELKEGGTGGSKKYKTSFGRTNDKHNEKTDRSKDGEGWN